MIRERIATLDESQWLALRTQDVTSTEVAALFMASPYITNFELWHRKKSKGATDFDINERMLWGTRLQQAIAEGVAKDQGWVIRPMNEYGRIPQVKLGSSFDYCVMDGEIEHAILEIKNVDGLQFKSQWIFDGDEIEAPAHIEFQLQHQMLVSGINKAYLAALVNGNRVELITREANPQVQRAILEKASEFWTSIVRDFPPVPDFSKDADFVIKMNQNAITDLEIESSQVIEDLAKAYQSAAELEKIAIQKKKEAKAKLLIEIGDASKVKGSGFSISASMVADTIIPETKRSGYRSFRVHFAKV